MGRNPCLQHTNQQHTYNIPHHLRDVKHLVHHSGSAPLEYNLSLVPQASVARTTRVKFGVQTYKCAVAATEGRGSENEVNG